MKRKKVWRYTCEHCGKAGCSGGHIAKHERKCTANPQRICGMCALVGEKQHTMTELFVPIATAIEYAKPTPGDPDEVDVNGLRELTKNCPACILSALRQFRGDYTVDVRATDFDFKKECATWMDQYHRSCCAPYPGGDHVAVFDRAEWLATWRTCLPVEKPLRVSVLAIGFSDMPSNAVPF